MILDWPNCLNARDLGGLPATDGRTIRPGKLMRSDNHDRLTPQGIQAIRAAGVTQILDLRWEWEARKYRSPFAGDPLYRNIPLVKDDDGETYTHRADQSRELIGAAVVAVTEAPPGGVLIHCHEGRDRTGILTALALAVAGVPDKVIVTEYALSEGCDPREMQDLLIHLRQNHGGVTPYLLGAGVTPGHLQTLRHRLTK